MYRLLVLRGIAPNVRRNARRTLPLMYGYALLCDRGRFFDKSLRIARNPIFVARIIFRVRIGIHKLPTIPRNRAKIFGRSFVSSDYHFVSFVLAAMLHNV
jgi:hypothetical protein